MLPSVVLAVMVVGRWLEDVRPVIIFTLSSSDSVLPKLLTIFEDRVSYQQGNVYKTKQNNTFCRTHRSGETFG